MSKKAKTQVKAKKKAVKIFDEAIVHINASFNNTLITVTNLAGDTLAQASAGEDFRGSRKSTPFAAQVAATKVCERVADHKIQRVIVYIKGPGSGRESAVRGIASSGLRITMIADLTGVPHNGCRGENERRV